ncbi:MAG: tetraacyldisaccharide 4'-kinase [Casimicrobiaceae bacterium]
MTAATRLVDAWYRPRLTAATLPLVPLSWLYGAVVALRRHLYRAGLLKSRRVSRPVIIVGNLTVGGGGKTPATLALARALAIRGARPGIVSRGHGGAAHGPTPVRADDEAARVGDEALLLATAGFPVFVGRDRASAAAALIAAHPECTLIVCDDGLQHLALARDAEIVMVDATRGFGNGHLLPAGPLREPQARLLDADAVAWLGADPPSAAGARETRVTHRALPFRRVADDAELADAAAAWQGLRVVAIAGIANPQRFFDLLGTLGVHAQTLALDDHHRYVADDLPVHADIVVMTQKDAVKCRRFADARCYYLPIEAVLDPRLVERVATLIGNA